MSELAFYTVIALLIIWLFNKQASKFSNDNSAKYLDDILDTLHTGDLLVTVSDHIVLDIQVIYKNYDNTYVITLDYDGNTEMVLIGKVLQSGKDMFILPLKHELDYDKLNSLENFLKEPHYNDVTIKIDTVLVLPDNTFFFYCDLFDCKILEKIGIINIGSGYKCYQNLYGCIVPNAKDNNYIRADIYYDLPIYLKAE